MSIKATTTALNEMPKSMYDRSFSHSRAVVRVRAPSYPLWVSGLKSLHWSENGEVPRDLGITSVSGLEEKVLLLL